MRSVIVRYRGRAHLATAAAVIGGALLSLVLLGAQARAATDVYPTGGGTFSGGAQGWETTEANCDILGIELLCGEPVGEYDGTEGDPNGSLAARSTIPLNAVGLFDSDVSFESPSFAVTQNGAAHLHIDRRFAPGGLLELGPEATYTVSLLDHSDGGKVVGKIEETLDSAEEGFSGQNAAAEVVAGHDYAITIDVNTTATLSLTLGGEVQTFLDNARLVVQSSDLGGGDNGGDNGGDGNGGDGNGDNGGGDGSGDGTGRGNGRGQASSVSDRALAFLVRRFGIPRRAVLRRPGNYAVTRVRCPARARNACVFAVRGMANGRRASTAHRIVRVGSGSSRQVGLRIRPRFRRHLRRGNTMLVRVLARSGEARAIVGKRLVLLKRR